MNFRWFSPNFKIWLSGSKEKWRSCKSRGWSMPEEVASPDEDPSGVAVKNCYVCQYITELKGIVKPTLAPCQALRGKLKVSLSRCQPWQINMLCCLQHLFCIRRASDALLQTQRDLCSAGYEWTHLGDGDAVTAAATQQTTTTKRNVQQWEKYCKHDSKQEKTAAKCEWISLKQVFFSSPFLPFPKAKGKKVAC